MSLTEEKIFELYKMTIEEEHYFLKEHQQRIAFFAGIVSALMAGNIAGLFQAKDTFQLTVLLISPLFICGVCEISIRGASRFYQRFLVSISMRAKLEQMLGLTELSVKSIKETDGYWSEEPLIPLKYLEGRKQFNTSQEWLSRYMNKGYQLWITLFFRGGEVLALSLFIITFFRIWRSHSMFILTFITTILTAIIAIMTVGLLWLAYLEFIRKAERFNRFEREQSEVGYDRKLIEGKSITVMSKTIALEYPFRADLITVLRNRKESKEAWDQYQKVRENIKPLKIIRDKDFENLKKDSLNWDDPGWKINE